MKNETKCPTCGQKIRYYKDYKHFKNPKIFFTQGIERQSTLKEVLGWIMDDKMSYMDDDFINWISVDELKQKIEEEMGK